ncbi:hypothetical protein [Microcoleus sp. herbarium12]|uniref:hypothetical protein n=1 Tax=Microcoleus sp. herbarium12 TaxID=3055437 RepID=UPI002FD20436
MNSQKYKIQALIAEIDEVLSKPAPRLPWTGSIDTVHQRQLLERVRTYLLSSESKLAARDRPATPNVRPVPVPVPKVPPLSDRPSAAEQIMLAVTGEISHLRSTLTEPLQAEVEALRQQQQALIQEIKHLEARRQQQQSLAQQQANQQQIISEFLQVLRSGLEETLERDFSQMIGSLENKLLLDSNAAASEPSTLNPQVSSEQPLLTPAQRLEQMEQFQARADSMLMRLDSTMGIVFEALHANLESYQASLGQGIENMHGLSQQSEAMFAALVNHLAAQLGREASSYVQQPIEFTNLESATPTSAEPSVPDRALSQGAIEPSVPQPNRSRELEEQDRLPWAGTEISPQFGQLRRERERLISPISLPDLADDLLDDSPETPGQVTRFSGADSEDILAETGENIEDLYASLFAGEVAELELENFAIENTETAEVLSQSAEYYASEPLNDAESLFVNLLDEGESIEDFLAVEDSDFVIGNSVEDITLDTEGLFEPQPATVPSVSEPPDSSSIALTLPSVSEPPDSADDRPNLETAQNRGDGIDTAAVAESPDLRPAEISSHRPTATPRVPRAADVQTGDFDQSVRPDDAYIQASPEEDLLPVEVLDDDNNRSIKLDVNTLELLERDLYNLEGLENKAAGRSNLSAANNLDLVSSSSENDTENPFADAADEELSSLEDLFSEDMELSSEDEPFVLENEFGEDWLAGEEEESQLTLDEILVSLNQIDRANAEISQTDERPPSSPESQKKNLISTESKAGLAEANTEIGKAKEQDFVTGAIAPTFGASHNRPRASWYLGIDFGSSGMSAALLDRTSEQLHPIYWEAPQAQSAAAGALFRIPSVAVLWATAPGSSGEQVSVKSVGLRQFALPAGEFLLQNFKLPLKVSIPYQREAAGMYEPLLQRSPSQAISIALPLQGLRALLATLNPRKQKQKFGRAGEVLDVAAGGDLAPEPVSDLICKASGLTAETLEVALLNLQGVILGTPAGWGNAYRFNLREAVLGADLVAAAAQIFVVEDAIATLLAVVTPVKNSSTLQSPALESVREEGEESAPLAVNASSFSGGTLILNAGAATVELALVELPSDVQNLTRADFTCQSFDVGGNAFDQDIVCQLLAKNETWGMSVDLPRPGHPDLPSRYQLQQRLQGSAFGLQLLEAARHLKVILQHQESFVLDIGQQHWDVKRRDLESLVLVPFVQQLNRELNALLSRSGMSPARINQAICAGGMGGWPAIARWLRQKLPNAIVVQDPEFEVDRDISQIHNSALTSVAPNTNFSQTSGRVACGLASLALYPQILEVSQQQYSDFFLLWELTQVLGAQTLSFEEILQLLERLGVNTRTCEARILQILAGKLPAGLLPEEEDFMMLAEESRQNPDWRAILAEPLFFEDVVKGYRLNIEHAGFVREYLGHLASSSQQKLLEPLIIAWDLGADTYR